MKSSACIFIGVVILLALVAVAAALQASSRHARASAVKIGATKEEVERLLGSATMVTPYSPLWRTDALAALFCDTAETWAYGSRFDFHSEFPWLRLRLFLPEPDDVAIEFSPSGRVVRVTIPQAK